MVVAVGFTEFATIFVSATSLYQVVVPLLQVAAKVELCPEHIVDGLADMDVGDEGVGLTVTEMFPDILLHPAALIHAT